MKEIEIWKDIEGYEGLYQISNFGRVKSLARTIIRNNGRPAHIKEKIKDVEIHKGKWLRVQLIKNNKKKNVRVHRLVAQAFIPNPENKPEVNHIDLDPSNNHVSNLEWVTGEENRNHYFNSDKYNELLNSYK